jgi:hypothetical protein
MPNPAPRLLALLGDSILDNARYTRPAPDTAGHLQSLLPEWTVELAAQDGTTIDLLPLQLAELAGRPNVIVLSLGGNDAVGLSTFWHPARRLPPTF